MEAQVSVKQIIRDFIYIGGKNGQIDHHFPV